MEVILSTNCEGPNCAWNVRLVNYKSSLVDAPNLPALNLFRHRQVMLQNITREVPCALFDFVCRYKNSAGNPVSMNYLWLIVSSTMRWCVLDCNENARGYLLS